MRMVFTWIIKIWGQLPNSLLVSKLYGIIINFYIGFSEKKRNTQSEKNWQVKKKKNQGQCENNKDTAHVDSYVRHAWGVHNNSFHRERETKEICKLHMLDRRRSLFSQLHLRIKSVHTRTYVTEIKVLSIFTKKKKNISNQFFSCLWIGRTLRMMI